MEEVTTLVELRQSLGVCTKCGLHQGRTNIVFGAGDENADLLFVGEGPGRVEDAKGLPFVGPAGKLLDELLQSINLSRSQVYITNVVKCRPPGNRDPIPDEIEKCNRYLVKQIELIKPRILCALGRVAAGVILQKNVQITKLHGQKVEGPGYFIVPALHPAAALRSSQSMAMIREDFENLRKYLDKDVAPPAPPAPEPEQMGLF
ncbi:MAG: uracil-DNA glycosylase [Actinobacteria bacterium]|nr:uracil-DNA glycosylase [Actinomycetota bacterium]